MEKIRFYRTGQVVRDIGIISFYEYLEAIDKGDLEVNLTNNFLEFNKFDAERLIEFLKTEKYMKNKKGDIGITGISNSDRFGSNNGPKNEGLYDNLKDIIYLSIEMNSTNNIMKFDKQATLLQKYFPTRECDICNMCLSTSMHLSKESKKKDDIDNRATDKTIYSFLGRKQANTYTNYFDKNLNICFTCELLNIFFLLNLTKHNKDFFAFCDSLSESQYINHVIQTNHKLSSFEGLLVKLAKLNSKRIKIYEKGNAQDSSIIKFQNKFNVLKLIQKVKLNSIMSIYNYNIEDKKDIKKLLDYIKILIFNDNYDIADQILLSHLVSTDKDSDNKYRYTMQNIELYNKFLEGGFEMDSNNIKSHEFFDTGSKLAHKIDDDKKRTIAFRFTQLMKSDSREQLFNELLGLLITHEVEIPKNFSYDILKSRSIDFHYNTGRLLEGLNNKEILTLKGGNEDE